MVSWHWISEHGLETFRVSCLPTRISCHGKRSRPDRFHMVSACAPPGRQLMGHPHIIKSGGEFTTLNGCSSQASLRPDAGIRNRADKTYPPVQLGRTRTRDPQVTECWFMPLTSWAGSVLGIRCYTRSRRYYTSSLPYLIVPMARVSQRIICFPLKAGAANCLLNICLSRLSTTRVGSIPWLIKHHIP